MTDGLFLRVVLLEDDPGDIAIDHIVKDGLERHVSLLLKEILRYIKENTSKVKKAEPPEVVP